MHSLVSLQDLTDSEKETVPFSGRSPAPSHDAYQAIGVTAEVASHAEAEEDPVAITFPGIKAEPEVSCVTVSMLGRFHKHGFPSLYEILLQ
jgi:hypothetical protein